MRKRQPGQGRSYLLLVALGAVVLAFMGLSLAVTATGTARFAVAMGYRAEVGYAVGGVFDIAKALLPVALLVFIVRRAFFSLAVIACAWLGLVTYSSLATHATVSAAIASVARSGTWKMESRTNTKSELGDLERRLTVLSQPMPPRPSRSVAAALADERVPVGAWRDSHECASIRGSRYFEKACSKVLGLRRELAVAKDYEMIEVRVGELRYALATAPIVATQDPLPRAFAATFGQLVPLDGDVGVALLLTLVVEIMSCFGLATVGLLREEQENKNVLGDRVDHQSRRFTPRQRSGTSPQGATAARKNAANRSAHILPQSTPQTVSVKAPSLPIGGGKPPSNVLPMRPSLCFQAARKDSRQGYRRAYMPRDAKIAAHVNEFIRLRVRPAAGASLGASEMRAAYEDWCTRRACEPLSQQKLGAELTKLGFARWKSCGLIRYRDLQLVA